MDEDKGRKLVKTVNGRWGFDPTPEECEWGRSIGDEFTCGESVMIRAGSQWLPGRFEAMDFERKDRTGNSHFYRDYYVILDIGLRFIPIAGTRARRPTQSEQRAREKFLGIPEE